jgi:hypothetical protein
MRFNLSHGQKRYPKSMFVRGNLGQVCSKLSLSHEKEQKGVLMWFEEQPKASPDNVAQSNKKLAHSRL